jgi:hypothetical protein
VTGGGGGGAAVGDAGTGAPPSSAYVSVCERT